PPTPTLPPRSFVAVQGVVYCKSCKYVGIPTLLGASPLSGAVVELKCKSSKIKEVLLTTTDKHGYFFVMAPKTVTSYGAHKCRISLVSSRLKKCKKATNLNFGAVGSPLFNPVPLTIGKLPYLIYSVGPFAFEAEKKCYPY
uniref:Pistil-specific extensin-like protein n=1 Tax=Kalanchoe fedtschenkoi TaxID=63787 RepID=A0A7N0RF28_KALFE